MRTEGLDAEAIRTMAGEGNRRIHGIMLAQIEDESGLAHAAARLLKSLFGR